MPVAGTEKTITVDSNVVYYYFLFMNRCSLPQGLRVQKIEDFCNFVLDKYPIAINKFIRTEYEQLVGLETIKNWLTKRFQKDLAISVDCCPLPRSVKVVLRDDYGFDCRSRDARYIQTCFNTMFRHLITENIKHFLRRHHSRGRRTMDAYLQHSLPVFIYTIDKCCSMLLTV